MAQEGNIKGEVIVDRSEGLNEEHATERREDTAHQKKTFWINLFTLIAVIVYASLTCWLACLTKNIADVTKRAFETSQRPFIGVDSVSATLYKLAEKGERIRVARSIQEAGGMEVRAVIKNFGPIPGINFVGTWKLFFNGAEQSTHRVSDTPHTLYPGQPTMLVGEITGEQLKGLLNGTAVLEIEITTKYEGPAGNYRECQKSRFNTDLTTFFNLGSCTH